MKSTTSRIPLRPFGWCFILLSLVLVAGCGGGGGSSGEAPAPTPTVSVTLSLDTSSTRVNESVTLTWSSSNASSCSASGDWSGSKSTDGSESLTVTERGTKTYTLSCGTVNRSVELGVLCTHSDTNDGTLVSSLEGLRTEINRVEGDGIDDIIYLQSGTYSLEESSPIIYDAKGTVEKISLIGCHPDDVVVDGNGASSIMHFLKNDEETNLTGWKAPFPSLYLEGFTVKNGVLPYSVNLSPGPIEELGFKNTEGGGIATERFIGKIKNMKFLDNIFSFRGSIETEIEDSYFENNIEAVWSGGSLHIKNSTFTNNTGTGGERGRTIYSTNGYLLEDGSVVDGNHLNFVIEDSTFTGGAGINVLRDYCSEIPCGKASIKNSTFEGLYHTPLIFYLAMIEITNSKFLNNKNGYWGPNPPLVHPGYCARPTASPCETGGALFISNYHTGSGVTTITDTEFTNNSTADYGGAIFFEGVRDCTVPYSDEETPCDPLNVTGFNPDHNLIIRNSVFKGNTSHRGAAIAIAKVKQGIGSFQRGNVLIENTSFTDNIGVVNPNVPSPSGPIRVHDPVTGFLISNPPADGYDTTIIASGGNIDANNITLSGNSADRIIDAKGTLTCDPSCSQ